MPYYPYAIKTLSRRNKPTSRLFNRRTGQLKKHTQKLSYIPEADREENMSPIVHRSRRYELPPIPNNWKHRRHSRGGVRKTRRLRKY